jgi:peptide/nickel transport system ATP-binding protein
VSAAALVEAEDLRVDFPVRSGGLWGRRGTARALDGVSLEVRRGECLALVGESGSGKTTLGRCLIRLVEPAAGRVRFDGEDLLALPPRELRRRRRRFQMVFQDPFGSLDPRQRVGSILAEPLALHGRRNDAGRIAELLDRVGLSAEMAGRFPHELSGGQRQRVGIARALAVEPDFLIADEPISALDLTVRAQILDLLADLRERLGLTMLFIAHDLAAVEQLADRVAVMYLGRIVELAPAAGLFQRPQHPYTVSLLSAAPVAEPVRKGGRRRSRIVLAGDPPSLLAPPPGCPFHPRCPIARPRCAAETPFLAPEPGDGKTDEHRAACFYPGELREGAAS